ncbi:MAG: hypothetical protein N3C60_04315 [Calditerrivibrio sp.]|nr:hypothetical protein [Calditerrivibrio sp.]
MNKTLNSFRFFGLKLETLEQAHKMSLPAAIMTGMMGVVSFVHCVTVIPDFLFLGFLDLVLWGVLGFGIYKNSRIAVINTFIMYILGGAYFRLIPIWQSNIFATIYIIILVFALWGTFLYNRLLKAQNKG